MLPTPEHLEVVPARRLEIAHFTDRRGNTVEPFVPQLVTVSNPMKMIPLTARRVLEKYESPVRRSLNGHIHTGNLTGLTTTIPTEYTIDKVETKRAFLHGYT